MKAIPIAVHMKATPNAHTSRRAPQTNSDTTTSHASSVNCPHGVKIPVDDAIEFTLPIQVAFHG